MTTQPTASTQNTLAQHFASLHQPGNPLILTNIWDAATASLAISHPATKAIATASYAIAASSGKPDNKLTFDENLARIKLIAPVVAEAGLPLTVDVQDGYEDLAGTVREVVRTGAVGCNIEDVRHEGGGETLRGVEEQVERIRVVKKIAGEMGVPDFVVNARTDVLFLKEGAEVGDAVERGRKYLQAGATTVFVWGRERGLKREEVGVLVGELGGRVNVIQRLSGEGMLRTSELRELGVARVSIGPGLYHKAMEGFKKGLEDMLAG